MSLCGLCAGTNRSLSCACAVSCACVSSSLNCSCVHVFWRICAGIKKSWSCLYVCSCLNCSCVCVGLHTRAGTYKSLSRRVRAWRRMPLSAGASIYSHILRPYTHIACIYMLVCILVIYTYYMYAYKYVYLHVPARKDVAVHGFISRCVCILTRAASICTHTLLTHTSTSMCTRPHTYLIRILYMYILVCMLTHYYTLARTLQSRLLYI